MDMAEHLFTLGQSFKDATKHRHGPKSKVSPSEIAALTGMGPKNVIQYLSLRKLPEDVKQMIGEGKTKFTHALILLRLNKAEYRSKISKIAREAYKEGWSKRQLIKVVEAIKSGKSYVDTKACQRCKRAFPKEKITNLDLCPQCLKDTLEEVEQVVQKPLPINQKFSTIKRILKKHIEICRKTNCEGIDCLTQCAFYAERFKKRKRKGSRT